MKISGFTIIRNAIINEYPAVEAITSILPVVDEHVQREIILTLPEFICDSERTEISLELIHLVHSTPDDLLKWIEDNNIRVIAISNTENLNQKLKDIFSINEHQRHPK